MKPMLAATTDGTNLSYPLLASPKLDGIRCIIYDAKPLTRTLKLVPNKFIQSVLGQDGLTGLDGELVVGKPNANDVYVHTNSGVMSREGEPNFTFYVFDHFMYNTDEFKERLRHANALVARSASSYLQVVRHKLIHNEAQLLRYEQAQLKKGYEGIMLRDPRGEYKFGRSTLKQGWLMKLKRFSDSDAEILGVVQQLTNQNEAKLNALGLKERSSAKAGKKPVDMVGAFSVRDIHTGVEFEIGTGMTEKQRKEWWKQRKSLVGKIVKYKYQPVGVKDKPRFPVFLAFRDKRDL